MKKLISLFAILMTFACASAQFTTPRFGTTPNADNTGRALTYKYTTPAVYSGTVSVLPSAFENYIKPAAFTGTVTVTLKAAVGSSQVCDKLCFMFTGNTGASATITFATNFKVSSATTVVGSGKKTIIWFRFDGVAWLEEERTENL